MKKLLLGISFAAVMCLMGTNSEAAGAARGAKTTTTTAYSTTASSVAVNTPAAVYSVTLGTGTAGTDNVTLFDAASIGSLGINTQTFKVRVNVSSSTQNTVVSFDPPLQFNNGIIAINSAGTIWSMITYEKGRVTQGY